jgi:phage/plasmid-like protein (TIGR03299 family)
MSQETYKWLAENVRAGFANTRRPWWADQAEAEGHTTNLYPEAVPMDEVIKLIASWEPITEGLYTADMELVPTHKLVRASDNKQMIGVIGANTAVHSYRDWLVGTVQEIVGDEAQISSAGLLQKRAQAWVQIERPNTAVGPDGILFSPFVLLSGSLNSTISSQINQNTKMVICDNTMEIGRRQGLAISIKGTSNSGSRLGVYRSVMAAIMAGENDFREELERQLSVKVDDTQLGRFLDSFIPVDDDDHPKKKTRSDRKRQEITDLYRNDPRVAQWKGTEFGVVQAVNTWQTHMSQLRNATGYEMNDTNLRAMRNYAQLLRPRDPRKDSADMETVRILESVL